MGCVSESWQVRRYLTWSKIFLVPLGSQPSQLISPGFETQTFLNIVNLFPLRL